MKVKAYLRVAKMLNGKKKVTANARPLYSPINDSSGYPYPTIAFAVEFDIPDKAFDQASEVIAQIKIPEERFEVAAEVVQPELVR